MALNSRVGRGLGAALLAGCIGFAAAPAAAQLAPSQPIKIVVSAPAGGAAISPPGSWSSG